MSITRTQALEAQREDFKKAIKLRDAAIKLSENKLFKDVILDEFCVKEAARYAHTSADPSLSDKDQANALALAQAGGHLRRWLSVIVRMGNQAEDQMADLDEAIEEARVEEVDVDGEAE